MKEFFGHVLPDLHPHLKRLILLASICFYISIENKECKIKMSTVISELPVII